MVSELSDVNMSFLDDTGERYDPSFCLANKRRTKEAPSKELVANLTEQVRSARQPPQLGRGQKVPRSTERNKR